LQAIKACTGVELELPTFAIVELGGGQRPEVSYTFRPRGLQRKWVECEKMWAPEPVWTFREKKKTGLSSASNWVPKTVPFRSDVLLLGSFENRSGHWRCLSVKLR
jgi:hypothetical protein